MHTGGCLIRLISAMSPYYQHRFRSVQVAILLLLLGVSPAGAQQGSLVMKARQALDSGRYPLALELAEQATRIDPENVEAWIVLGASLERQPEGTGRALSAYRQAARLAPNLPEVNLAIGKIHLSRMRGGIVEAEALAAIRSFDRVIEINPSHAQAYDLRGVAYLEGLGDSVSAGADFERQLGVVPGHPEASVHLLQLAVDVGEWELAEEMAAPVLLSQPWDTRIYRPLLRLYIEKRKWEAAALVARRYLTALPASELDLIYDLSPLLPTAERGGYEVLGPDARMLYWRSYWGERGGAGLDSPSSRLIEHIWRVAEARALFGTGRFPWDIRGELYVRYGPPGYRVTSTSGTSLNLILDGTFQSRMKYRMLELGMPYSSTGGAGYYPDFFSPTLLPSQGGASSRRETWVYWEEGLLFYLEDPLISGEFRLASQIDQQLNERLQVRQPILSAVEEITEPLRPMLQIAQFRGLDGKTRFHTYLSMPVVELAGSSPDISPSEILTSSVTLTDDDANIIAEGTRQRLLQAGPATEVQRSRRFVDAVTFLAPAGEYRFSAFIEHGETDRTGSYGPQLIEVRDFSGSTLAMSDVVLATTDSLGPSENHLLDEGLIYLPQPGGIFDLDRPFIVYFEVYNLARDGEGISTYDLTYEVFPEQKARVFPQQIQASVTGLPSSGRRTPAVSLTSTYRSLRPDVVHSIVLSMEGHPEDFYRLRISIEDTLTGDRVYRETTFRILYPVYPPPPPLRPPSSSPPPPLQSLPSPLLPES